MSDTIPEPADMAREFFEAREIHKADWNATGFADGVRTERERAKSAFAAELAMGNPNAGLGTDLRVEDAGFGYARFAADCEKAALLRDEISTALRRSAFLVNAACVEADGRTDPFGLAAVQKEAAGFARLADRLKGEAL